MSFLEGADRSGPEEDDDGGEFLVWRARPALRGVVGTWFVSVFVVVAVSWLIDWAEPSVREIGRNYDVDFFRGFVFPWWIHVVTSVGPLLAAVIRTMEQKAVLYVLTTRRLLIHRGILNRVHDQIELQRIRDLQVVDPFLRRILGLGFVWVFSVDRLNQEVLLVDLENALRVRDIIHENMKREQLRLGYREFESTSNLD